jgi:hypothetical protein
VLGAAGAPAGPLAPAVAAAAPLPPQLKRATWLALRDRAVTLDDGTPLTLAAVEDLPVAARIAALRGHDGAFVLRFGGPAGIAPGTHTLRGAELGAVDLLLGPVGAAEGDEQTYEAVVDRTIVIAGVNEEDEPIVVDTGARAEQPAAASAPAAAGAAAPTFRRTVAPRRAAPRLRGLELTRGRSGRVLIVDAALADAREIVQVRAVLRAEGRVVARARAAVRGSRKARLRFVAAEGARVPRRAELTLALVARDGRVTRIRKRVSA